MRFTGIFLIVFFVASNAFAQFPVIEQGDLQPNDPRLGRPIDKSKDDELTIASFNIRNLGSRGRSLKDYFYDQFLTTPPVAAKLADGGQLLEDVGMIAFGKHNSYMKKVIEKSKKRRTYALTQFMKEAEITKDTYPDAYERAMNLAEARDDATWILSDHRLLWMQLKLWQGW